MAAFSHLSFRVALPPRPLKHDSWEVLFRYLLFTPPIPFFVILVVEANGGGRKSAPLNFTLGFQFLVCISTVTRSINPPSPLIIHLLGGVVCRLWPSSGSSSAFSGLAFLLESSSRGCCERSGSRPRGLIVLRLPPIFSPVNIGLTSILAAPFPPAPSRLTRKPQWLAGKARY